MKRITSVILILFLMTNVLVFSGTTVSDNLLVKTNISIESPTETGTVEVPPTEVPAASFDPGLRTRGGGGASTRSQSSSEWPMFMSDLVHNGVSPSSAPDTKFQLWTNTTGGGQVYASPIVADGKVFFGKTNGRVYGFDMLTGQRVMYTGGHIYGVGYGISATGAYNDGHVFIITTQNNTIYRVNATDGTVNWQKDYANGAYGGSSPAVYNKTVIVGTSQAGGSDYGKLVVLNETTGAEIWKYTINTGSYGITSSPAVWNDMIYVGGCDNYLYAFNFTQGGTPEYFWRYYEGGASRDKWYASPVIANDTLFIGHGAYSQGAGVYHFYAFDPNPDDNSDGSITGSDTDEGLDDPANAEYDMLWAFNISYSALVTPVFYNDIVYMGIENGSLYALKQDPDGSGYIDSDEILWQRDIGNTLWASPVISDNRIYIGSQSGVFYCLNATTGAIIWSDNLGVAIDGTAAIANDKVYIVDRNGKIYCYAKSSDITPPQVTSVYPAISASGVSVNTNVSAIFSESMQVSSITTSNIEVKNSTGVTVPGTINYNDPQNNMTLDPTNPLEFGEIYTVTITTGVRDFVGNTLDGDGDGLMEGSPTDDYSWSFTTGALVAPKLNAIPQQMPTEDITHTLDLTPYIIDPDTPVGSLTILENSSYVTVVGHNLSFLYPNGILNDLVNVSVGDGFGTVYRDVVVVVTPVNDAPVLAPIADQNAQEEVNLTLNLTTFVSDIDNTLDELSLSTNSSYDTISGFVITFNYPEGVTYEFVNITLSDGALTDSQEINIDITPFNDKPVLTNPAVTPSLGNPDTEFTYTVVYSDVENSAPSFVRVLIDNTPFDMTAVDAFDTNFVDGSTYEYKTTLSSGTHNFKFDCSDGGVGGIAETMLLNGPTVLELGLGGFQGAVKEKGTGTPIESANISITNLTDISEKYIIVSLADGSYEKSNLMPGTYELYASASGYKTSSKVQKLIEPSKITVVDFALEKILTPQPGNDTDVTNAKINVSNVFVEEGKEITFTGSAVDEDGDELTFNWDFGDGVKNTGETVSHTYAKTGFYTVKLTVTDTDGTSATTNVVITVTESTVVPPTDTPVRDARIEANRTKIFEGEGISFTGVAADDDGDILTFTWDFGDGSGTETGRTIIHIFEKEGTYTVSLKVTDLDNNFALATKTIEVQKRDIKKSAPGEKESNVLALSIILIIIVIIVIVAALMILKSKKKKEEPPAGVPGAYAGAPAAPGQYPPMAQPVEQFPAAEGGQYWPVACTGCGAEIPPGFPACAACGAQAPLPPQPMDSAQIGVPPFMEGAPTMEGAPPAAIPQGEAAPAMEGEMAPELPPAEGEAPVVPVEDAPSAELPAVGETMPTETQPPSDQPVTESAPTAEQPPAEEPAAPPVQTVPCPTCGAQLAVGATPCPGCGTALNWG